MASPFSKPSPFQSPLRTAIIIFGLLIGVGVGGGAIVTSLNSSNPQTSPLSQSPLTQLIQSGITPTRPANPYNVLFAKSMQGATDLMTKGPFDNSSKLVSSLPDAIKHINFISPSEIIFIDELNDNEHGKSIKKYNSEDGSTTTLVALGQSTWGIDDVVSSPDGTYIAWWEVQFTNQNQLLGGFSRVFVKKILPSASAAIQLTNEVATETTPLHYPLFFDRNNRLYLDTFIPNGGGFYLGLSIVENPGANVFTPIPDMKDGDYLSDPELSPDGTKILFTAYDGSASFKYTSISGLSVNRTSNINPNLLVVKDLTTGTKQTLLGSSNGAQYVNPKWSNDGTIVSFLGYHLTSPTSSQYDGVFTFRLTDASPQKVNGITSSRVRLLSLTHTELIWGKPTSEVGSLGPKYAPILSQINTTDIISNQTTSILAEPLIQYVNISPGNISGKEVAQSNNSIQFSSFKPKIVAQKRQDQQNDPQTTPSVTPTGGPTVTPGPTSTPGPSPTPWTKPKCRDYCQIPEPTPLPPSCVDFSKCYDSPLYLYPQTETNVKIQVSGATLFSDIPEMENNSWNVKAYPDGKIRSRGGEYSSINYSYIGDPQPPPPYGTVVDKKDLAITLKRFAEKLGLNEKETNDFVSFWTNTLPTTPYYLVSFYPKETAQKIIQYSIRPEPNSFLQIIMYFKPLEYKVKLPPPTFPKFERKGFVAVDWSGVVDDK